MSKNIVGSVKSLQSLQLSDAVRQRGDGIVINGIIIRVFKVKKVENMSDVFNFRNRVEFSIIEALSQPSDTATKRLYNSMFYLHIQALYQ